MSKTWSKAQHERFSATMAAKAAAKTAAKRTTVVRSPAIQPQLIYRMAKGGRLERLRLRTIKVYAPD